MYNMESLLILSHFYIPLAPFKGGKTEDNIPMPHCVLFLIPTLKGSLLKLPL
jgi:hypothetical protein